MTSRSAAVAAGLMVVGLLGACSASSTGGTEPAKDAGPTKDTGSTKEAGAHKDAKGGADTGSPCSSQPTCTGRLSGGVTGPLTTCTASGEQGTAVGFGEVTFSFTAGGDGGSGAITGSGNVSTTGKFKPGAYAVDAGLWNDTGSTGVGRDSLWTVSWTGASGTAVMAECNGIASPDETPSLCTGATLDLTGVDACDDVHGTFEVTLPAYMGTPSVTVQLSF